MSVWKKLQNPYALVGQGFVLGGLIFFATNGETLGGSAAASAVSAPTAGAPLLPSAQASR
jgi:hypothetical protein